MKRLKNPPIRMKSLARLRKLSVYVFIFLFICLTAGFVLTHRGAESSVTRIEHDVIPVFGLPPNYTEADVRRALRSIVIDKECVICFQYLSETAIQDALETLTLTLLENRTEKELRYQLEFFEVQADQAGQLFYHLDYPSEYFDSPQDFSELQVIVEDFFEKKLILELARMFYLATHQRDIVNDFNSIHVRAVLRFKQLSAFAVESPTFLGLASI